MRSLFLAALMCVGGPVLAGDDDHGNGIVAHDVKAAASIGLAKSGAGYMVIMNHGLEDDRLIEVRADLPRIEIHNIEEVDGQTKMVRQDDGVLIPGGGHIALAPGGLHVMFMGLPKPFVAGESFKATLVLENAGEIPVVFEIVDRELIKTGGTMDHEAMDHSGHGGHDGKN